jgi:alkyl hydroperoxide reductase subunit D
MLLDTLKESLPAYARDLGLNLAALEAETHLSDQQKWGVFLASAYAVGSRDVIRAVETAADQAGLGEAAKSAAKAAAAIMGMNNIYYRALHLMKNHEYRTLPARLRMNVILNPGVEKTDFELWCLAVSAVNGCDLCLDAHEGELKKRGVSALAIQAALRIAAVTHAVSHVAMAEAAERG